MGVIVKPKNLNDRQVKRVDRIAESNPDRARTVASRISDRRNARGAENPQIAKAIEAKRAMAQPAMKKGGMVKKAKSGGSFPDLNKDGKVTKADILKGRGVIAKSGMKMAKKPVMKFGGTLSPNKSNVSKYVSNLNKAKSGAKMKRGC